MSYFKQRGVSLPIILITLFAVVGIASSFIFKKEDGQVEEMMEDQIEDQIEVSLSLDRDELDGKIDLTPFSPENSV